MNCSANSDIAVLPSAANSGIARIAALLCVLATFSSFSIQADSPENNDSHWYVGTAVGNVIGSRSSNEYRTDLANSGVAVSSLDVDDSRIGWKFNIGFDVSQSVAIEAGYMDLNDVNLEANGELTDVAAFAANGSNIQPNSADGFTLSSIYRYSVSQNFGLTGSIGVFNWDGDFSTRVQPADENISSDSNSGTDFYFGLGGGYQLFDDVTLSIEWEHYQLDSENAEIWSIGVDYHFK